LIYYFPQTVDSPDNISAFKNVFECGLTMISVNPLVNAKLQKEDGLPNLSYRISADYGRVDGNNLYQVTNASCGDDYHFDKIHEYPIDEISYYILSIIGLPQLMHSSISSSCSSLVVLVISFLN
jgi:hypothetical protein